MTPTDSQLAAIRAIVEWYKDPAGKQVFYLAGFAGTGKSTVYKFVLEALADHGAHKVVTCAYTGKAAHVLRKKGTSNAMTIHGAVYSVREDPKTGKITFELNPIGPAATADLIGLDECSMVDDMMADDLMSFGRRILVMGDPGQLPPIRGPGAFTAGKPDVFLTEIHRQAADSPIIQLATMAREGRPIRPGTYGPGVRVLQLTKETSEEVYVENTQPICGIHTARHRITAEWRRRQGFTSPMPEAGERLICCRNDRTLGLFNGALGNALRVKQGASGLLMMDVVMEDLTGSLDQMLVSPHLFQRHTDPSAERPKGVKGLQDFDFGRVLTAHKAQGSEWDHVTIVDDSGAFREDSARWAYTAITRASEGLTLLKRAA